MSEQNANDERDQRAAVINDLRTALLAVDDAKNALYNASGDPAALDHAASQYVLARERLSAAADALDVESLEGVQREREAASQDATNAPATDADGDDDAGTPQAPAPAQEGVQTGQPAQA